MKVVQDGLWLCDDCTIAAVNGDVSGVESDLQVARIWAGLELLGPHLVHTSNESEFSRTTCDCCMTRLHGRRNEFAILGAS